MSRNIILIGNSKKFLKVDYKDDIEVIYAFTSELEDLKQVEEKGETEYFILILIKTDSEDSLELENIQKEWFELTGGAFSMIEYITDHIKRINKNFRQMFDELPSETIRFNIPAVGFISESIVSRKEARKLLLESVIKPFWQFWK